MIHHGHGTGDAAVGLQGQFRIDGHFKALVWNGQRAGPKSADQIRTQYLFVVGGLFFFFGDLGFGHRFGEQPLKPHPVAVGGHESTGQPVFNQHRAEGGPSPVLHQSGVNGTPDQFAIDFHFLGGKRGVAFVERDLLGLPVKRTGHLLTVGQLQGALLAERFHGRLLHHMLDPADPDGLNGRSFFKGLTIKNHQVGHVTRCDGARPRINTKQLRGDGGQRGHGVGWAETTANGLADAIVDIGGLREAVGGQRKNHTGVTQSRRVGGGFVPRHQVTQRHRVRFFSISNHRGIREINRKHKLSAHGNNVIQSAKLVAGAEHHHVQLKLFGEGVAPVGIHLVFGVKQHQLASRKNGSQSHHGVRLWWSRSSCTSGHPTIMGGLVVGRIHQRLPGQRDGSHQRNGIALKAPAASAVKAHALHGVPRP